MPFSNREGTEEMEAVRSMNRHQLRNGSASGAGQQHAKAWHGVHTADCGPGQALSDNPKRVKSPTSSWTAAAHRTPAEWPRIQPGGAHPSSRDTDSVAAHLHGATSPHWQAPCAHKEATSLLRVRSCCAAMTHDPYPAFAPLMIPARPLRLKLFCTVFPKNSQIWFEHDMLYMILHILIRVSIYYQNCNLVLK
jgi:hypothetical protein